MRRRRLRRKYGHAGGKLSHAAAMRAHAKERAALIRALGMKPEPPNAPYAERYAATAGEMRSWVRKDGLPEPPEWTDYLTSDEREAYFKRGVR